MRNRSETWKRLAVRGEFTTETVAVINGTEYSTITAPVVERGTLPGNVLSVGNCIIGSLRFTIMTTDTIPRAAQIEIKSRIVGMLDDDTEATYSEWLTMGTFWIDKRTVNDELTELECFDSMMKGYQGYSDDSQALVWPKPMQTVVDRCAEQMGVQLDARTVINTGEDYMCLKPDDDMTLLDVLGFIGAIHGGNWIITPENKLRLVPIVSPPTESFYIIDEEYNIINTPEGDRLVWRHGGSIPVNHPAGGSLINVPVVLGDVTTAQPYTVSRVTMSVDSDTWYTAGDDTGFELKIEQNPYATQALCNLLYEDIQGKEYVPYTATKACYDPAAEIGDWIIIGDLVRSVIYNETLTFDLTYQADISAPGEDELDSEYPYQPVMKKTQYTLQDLKKSDTVIKTEIRQTQESITVEYTRATTAETALSNDISDEETRAKSAESGLSTDISTETARATRIEESLASRLTIAEGNITAEVTRATTAETTLSGDIDDEETRAKNAESNLSADISTETSRATRVEESLSSRLTIAEGAITAEVTRATAAETTLTGSIGDEETRAKAIEESLASRLTIAEGGITAEVTRATTAETTITNNLTGETTRATNEESRLSGLIAVNAGNIELKVAKDNVIASINASAETSGGSTLTISADKLNLQGYATFTALQTSGGATVHGSNITASTLNSSKFDSSTKAAFDRKITTYYQASAPTASVVGDLWIETDNGNKLYRWNGTTWVNVQDTAIQQALSDAATAQTTADGKIVTFAQTTQPTATDVGDLWIDTDDGNKLYRWNGAQWSSVQDTAIGTTAALANQALQTASAKITTFYQTSTPTATAVGDLWIDTDDGNKLYRWNGTTWDDSQDDGIQTALTNAADAQSTADSKIVTFAQASQPTATDTGDLWLDTDDGNKLYRWSGTAWVNVQDTAIDAAKTMAQNAQTTANGKITTYYQANTPTEMAVGDLWIDTDDGNKLYRYNGNNNWVDVQDTEIQTALTNASNAQSTADSKIVTFAQTSQPTATDTGDLWIDTSTAGKNKLYRYNGSSWVSVQDAQISEALAKATTAAYDADGAWRMAEDATARSQTIYKSMPSGTTTLQKNETWVTQTGNIQNTWTSTRPEYNTNYPVLFVAQQRQSMHSYETGATWCDCTTPVMDETTTIIDGGKIITNSITANSIALNTITSDRLTVSAINNIRLQSGTIAWNATNSSMTESGVLTCNGATINGNFETSIVNGGRTYKAKWDSGTFSLTRNNIQAFCIDGRWVTVDGDGNLEYYDMNLIAQNNTALFLGTGTSNLAMKHGIIITPNGDVTIYARHFNVVEEG